MYMYKGILNGCKICFSEYDLGIHDKNLETKTVRFNQTNYRKQLGNYFSKNYLQ